MFSEADDEDPGGCYIYGYRAEEETDEADDSKDVSVSLPKASSKVHVARKYSCEQRSRCMRMSRT